MLSHWLEHMEIATHRSTNMAAVTNSWLAVRNFTPQTNDSLRQLLPQLSQQLKHETLRGQLSSEGDRSELRCILRRSAIVACESKFGANLERICEGGYGSRGVTHWPRQCKVSRGQQRGAGSTHRLYSVAPVAPGCLLGYKQSTLIILISAC
jgi:hypothetical protein